MDSQNDQLRATDLEENIASYIGIADTWQSLWIRMPFMPGFSFFQN